MKSRRRSYRMTARAEAAEQTGQRILRAMTELFADRPYEAITLKEVADRSKVTLQTVLRRFGSTEQRLAAAAADGSSRVEAQRAEAPIGDVAGAVKNLFAHYEQWGRTSLRMLEQEHQLTAVGVLTRGARQVHARWVTRVFAPQLAGHRGGVRLAQLVALTDVYLWKLLRLDQGLSRPKAERAVVELIEALCAPGGR